MYGSRLGRIGRKKPHLYFDKRWDVANDMQVGDRGQIIANVEITKIFTETDPDGDEYTAIEMTVQSTEKAEKTKARLF